MSPSAAAQQPDVAAVAQLDGLGDPSVDALALAAVGPFGGAVVAHVIVDERGGQLAALVAEAAGFGAA